MTTTPNLRDTSPATMSERGLWADSLFGQRHVDAYTIRLAVGFGMEISGEDMAHVCANEWNANTDPREASDLVGDALDYLNEHAVSEEVRYVLDEEGLSLRSVADLERALLEDEGYNIDAFRAWCEETGEDFAYDNRRDFDDAYCGEWDSFREYADNLAEELLDGEGLDADSLARRHFDFDGFARDLTLSGENFYSSTPVNTGVFVFRAY